jgi:hypothetical protein
VLVERDAKGTITKRAAPVPNVPAKVSHRAQLRKLTEGGLEQAATLRNIANGMPWRAELPDGSYTDWIVPTTAERMQAAQFLYEQQRGKAVAATEIMRVDSEGEEYDRKQLAALSEEQLDKWLERSKKGEVIALTEGEEE